jgi:signal transduction histidine kinase
MAKAGALEQADEALAEIARISQQALRELRLLMDTLSLPADEESD